LSKFVRKISIIGIAVKDCGKCFLSRKFYSGYDA
jgi:hypothetical protein